MAAPRDQQPDRPAGGTSRPVRFGRRRPHAEHGLVRRVLGVLVLAGLVAGFLEYRHLTDSERVRSIAQRYLEKLSGGEVTVQSAEFSLFGDTRLSRVWITEPAAASQHDEASEPPPGSEDTDQTQRSIPATVFSCAELRLRHQPVRALLGDLAVDEIVAVHPVLSVFRDMSTGQYNVSRLMRPGRLRRSDRSVPLPVVRLRDARIRLGRRTEGQGEIVEDLNLNIVARPADDARSYELAWEGGATQTSRGRSRLSLETMAITDLEGGLPWVSVEGALLAADGRFAGAQAWCDLLGLTGQLQVRDFHLAPGGPDSASPRATIELAGVSLSVPVDESERSVPLEQRYLRFLDVDGHLDLGPGDARAVFTASLHGGRCTLDARLTYPDVEQPVLSDLGFEIDATLESFTLPRPDVPEQARLIHRWKRLAEFYRDFDPGGVINLRFRISKEAGPGPIHLRRAVLEAVGCDASYRGFPYRVTDLSGAVEYGPRGIVLQELIGRHGDGRITVSGTLTEVRWHCGIELDITGTNIPIDAALHDALSPPYRRVWDRFDLAGTTDLDVSLRRERGTPGHPQPWRSRVTARLADVSAEFSGFPYPVAHIRGELEIDDQRLTVRGLSGSAGSAGIAIEGEADLGGGESDAMDLRLTARGVSFDERLSRALPESARSLLERFRPEGAFDLGGRLSRGPGADLAYDLTASLLVASVDSAEMPFPVTDLGGRIRLTPERIVLEDLAGRHEQTEVLAEGYLDRAAGRGGAELTVRCHNLLLDEGLREALPANAGSALGGLSVSGPADSVTVVRRGPPGEGVPARRRTTVRLRGVTVRHEALPFPIGGMRGTVTIDGDRIVLEELSGRHGEASVSLGGTALLTDQGLTGRFHAAVRTLHLDESLRQVLPWRLRRSWNLVRPAGTLDLELPRIEVRREGPGGPGGWDLSGTLTAREVSCQVGVKLAGLNGRLTGDAHIRGDVPGLSLACDLAVDRVDVSGRRLTNLTGRLERSAADRRLTLSDLGGIVHQGLFRGEVRLDGMTRPPTYGCTATVSDMQLGAFLQAGGQPAGADDAGRQITGLVDAHLYLTGRLGDAEAHRGGGRVSIARASIFRLPLLLSVLEVLDVAAPEWPALQSAAAEFLIQGRRIELRDLLIRSNTMAMIGTGGVQREPLELDLRLVAVSPHRWFKLPVLTELLEGAARELVEIRVQGPVSDPTITAAPLHSVGDAVDRLLRPERRQGGDPSGG